MMNEDETLLSKQLEREETSANAGYKKFKKNEDKNNIINNASSNSFGLATIKARHELVIENIEKLTTKGLGSKVVQIKDTLDRCTVLGMDGKAHPLMEAEVWAFIGLQSVIDNIFNPNIEVSKTTGRFGGDKNLVAKKDQSGLELAIGKKINDHMSLSLVKQTFPKWFRSADKYAKHRTEGCIRSSPSYWNKRMVRSIGKLIDKLEAQGDTKGAEFLRNRKPWTVDECRVIGEVVVLAVLMANADFFTSELLQIGKKKHYHIVLTPQGIAHQQQLFEIVSEYSHDVLPMLVEPNIITNETLGGWYKEVLQKPRHSHKGEIILSNKHLEFINRQARVKFELNPFTQQVIKRLMKEQKPLGKFDYYIPEDGISANQNLGIASITDPDTRNQLRNNLSKEQLKQANIQATNQIEQRLKQSMINVISMKLVSMTDKIEGDECNHIPMQYCFRGRIYSRVPFLSFQGTDAGKYLIRFHKKTTIDDRTEHWLKIGIANAAGCDKKCWDDRLKWFDKHREQIINVGTMVTTGDFTSAYEFLKQDNIDDPFCFAALANEYVKVFVDKTQDYTQVFVLVDASCSGTSIFNAWRLNKQGALQTNLIDTPTPADIYMAVWEEIKRLTPHKSFRASHIKSLEKSKLLRKMMKSTYVPASYASPPGEQLVKLKNFNDNELTNAGIPFKKDELKVLQSLWLEALDNVSSINTVVNWFKDRTKEAIANGAKEIRVTSSNGSLMILRYPKSDIKRISVLGNSDVSSRRKLLKKYKDEPYVRKLLNSVTANVTHMTDAAALCEALWDWDVPFVAIHDAVGVSPGKTLDEGIVRLKRGLIVATSHNIWDTFRQDNGLPLSSTTAGKIIGDLNLEDIMDSNYMFS